MKRMLNHLLVMLIDKDLHQSNEMILKTSSQMKSKEKNQNKALLLNKECYAHMFMVQIASLKK